MHKLPSDFDDYIQKEKRGLIVIDDLMQSVGDSQHVTDLFCNKVQHSNISVILLMQNLFYHGKERTTLLRCAHYLVVLKNPLDGSVPLYLAQKIMPLKKKLFIDIFDSATRKPFGYLFIDGRQTTPPSARFRSDLFADGVQSVCGLYREEKTVCDRVELKTIKENKSHHHGNTASNSESAKEKEESKPTFSRNAQGKSHSFV